MAERISAGASCAWGRIFLLYGEGEHPERFVPSIARSLLSGKSAGMTSGRQVRDLMDVRDAGAAFAELTLGSSVTGAVNIATGLGVTLEEVARRLAKTIGRPELLRIGALPDRENEPPILVADVARLTGEVGFHPRWDLESGLSHAVDYWRQSFD
jgi:nucleoside-diphosphate-sugar epimerase